MKMRELFFSVPRHKMSVWELPLLILVLSMVCPTAINAQKKEISAAQTIIKSGKNLEKAETSMRKLLADSVHRNNLKVRKTLTDAVRGQYLAGNEKLYLKQKQDTSALFDLALKMFADYEGLDSVDMMPDKKGRVRPRYREDNARFLHRYRPNLYYGGIYNIRKGQYEKAYHMMDAYLDCANQPLFGALHYENDTLNRTAAFWTLFCGHQLKNVDLALKNKELALQDTTFRENAMQMLVDIYGMKNDSINVLRTLNEGFDSYPRSSFFYPRLIDYYVGEGQTDSAMTIVERALAADKTSELALYAKSNLLLNKGDYDSCIAICDTLIARQTVNPEVYYNAGIAYLNKALLLEKGKASAKKRKAIQKAYKKSLPYLEKCRELAPKNNEMWANALYNIYLKLNMGKAFEEIEQYLPRAK